MRRDGQGDTFATRVWEPRDESKVADLHREALQSAGADIGDGPWDDDLRNVESVYLRARGSFLVVYDGEQLVGMGALRMVDEQTAELKRMRVKPSHHRMGIGRNVLNQLVETAEAMGYKRLVLDVMPVQMAAKQLYESAGFKQTGTTTPMHGNEVILFERWLR